MPPRPRSVSVGWLVATAAVLALVGAAASPPFVGPAAGAVVSQAFSVVCHQLPGRAPEVGGVPLALCHRCWGVLLGLLVGLAFAPAAGRDRLAALARRAQGRLLLAAAAPTALDWLVGVAGVWTNTPLSRGLTGAVFGVVAGAVLAANLFTSAPARAGLTLTPSPDPQH